MPCVRGGRRAVTRERWRDPAQISVRMRDEDIRRLVNYVKSLSR